MATVYTETEYLQKTPLGVYKSLLLYTQFICGQVCTTERQLAAEFSSLQPEYLSTHQRKVMVGTCFNFGDNHHLCV